MSISDRNSRIITATLVLSAITYIITKFNIFLSKYNMRTEVGKSIFLPFEVFVGTLVLASSITIYICGIIYILEELYCMGTINGELSRLNHEKSADTKYSVFIFIIKPLLVILAASTATALYLMNPTHNAAKIIVSLISVIGAGLLLIQIFKSRKLYNLSVTDLKHVIGIWGLAALFSLYFIIIGLEDRIETRYNFEFLDNGQLIVQGGTKFPESIKIKLYKNIEGKPVVIKEDDLSKSDFLEFKSYSLQETQEFRINNVLLFGKKEDVNWTKSIESYKTVLDYSLYLNKGEHSIGIFMNFKSGGKIDEYRLFNDVNVYEDRIEFYEEKAYIKP